MCGICGIAFADRQCTVPVEVLRRMNETLRFRGPDAEGVHVDCGTGLGHRRLSVIDLSGGAQPMADPSGQVAVTFNGEIYNFPEAPRRGRSGRLSVPDDLGHRSALAGILALG